jgi:hypothetical protein
VDDAGSAAFESKERGVMTCWCIVHPGPDGYVQSRSFCDFKEMPMADAEHTKEGLTEDVPSSEETIEQQGRDQTGQKQIRVRIDERNLQTG